MNSTNKLEAIKNKTSTAISCCILAALAMAFFWFYQTSEFPQFYLTLAILSLGCAVVDGKNLVAGLMGRASSDNGPMLHKILPLQDIARNGNGMEKLSLFVLPVMITVYQASVSELASESMIHNYVILPSFLMIALMQASVHSFKVPTRGFHPLAYVGSSIIHALMATIVWQSPEFYKGSPFLVVILAIVAQGALMDGFSMVQSMAGKSPGRNPRLRSLIWS